MAEFSNPNQQGGQDNRSLLMMLAVMLLAFAGLQFYRSKYAPAPTTPPSKQAAAQQAAATTPPPASAPSATPAAVAAASNTPAVQAAAESDTVIENELYRITFSNRGAQVKSWILKHTSLCVCQDAAGKQLDLVHSLAAPKLGLPLSFYTYDPSLTSSLNQALYVPSATGSLSAPATLTFKYSGNGIEATKTFTFDSTYVLHADYSVTKSGAPVRALLSWPGGFGDQDTVNDYAGMQLDHYQKGDDTHLAAKKISNGETLNGPYDWIGVSDRFFAAIFLPDSPSTTSVVALNNNVDVTKTIIQTGFGTKKAIEMPLLGAAVGDNSGHTSTRIFVGPKAIQVLKGVKAADGKVTLESLLEFGFWGAVGKYLFLSLQFIHSHIVSNWGWAIVILTIGINIITLPFKIKTMQNALKMQRIQPQMDAIKDKYKKYKVTDPKRNEMNAEIMTLQKDNGVNMFGGCIPTLITLPVLWAFFTMLPRVVELRQAHWYWLPDLQAPDPWHILPILMVLSMFLVQYYTPSPGVDPQQQKMMAFTMPLVSGFFTWNYGAGLALYWSVGNLISIAQQAIMNRTSLGREMREIAAKRARRKSSSGQGKVIQGKR